MSTQKEEGGLPEKSDRAIRVLLVDSSRLTLMGIGQVLEKEPEMELVGTASDGEEAVACCEQHRPDVLVVDYRMPPGINGVEVARRVIASGTAGRVVVYSNYTDPAVIRAAEALGAEWLGKGRLADLRAAVG